MVTAEAQPAEDICLRCGGPRTAWGCRTVGLGEFCIVKGLAEDPSRIRATTPAPNPRVERDREVAAALAAVSSAMKAADSATAAWEAAALRGWQTRARRVSGRQIFSVGGMLTEVIPPGATDADLRRLAEAEAEADMIRRQAGENVVKARQALEDARARVRGKLARKPPA